jgi:HEAT repeat protein
VGLSAEQIHQIWAVRKSLPLWEPPAKDEILRRDLSKLQSASKASLRLATERLVRQGQEVVPHLEKEIALHAVDPRAMAYLVNLASTLAQAGSAGDGASLIRVLEHSPVAVARTAALDALSALGSRELLPAMLQHAKREPEQAPLRVVYSLLGKWGDEHAAHFLTASAADWLDGIETSGKGQMAWASLLELRHPVAQDWLYQRLPSLAPSLRMQALTALLDQGVPDLRDSVRGMLDAGQYPSGRLRALAIAGLAQLQDWPGILAAANDPDESVQMAIAKALASPEAVSAAVGLDYLDELSRHPVPELQSMAIKALLAHGHSESLDSWLNRLRKYPNGQGSVASLLILREDGISDPRFARVLIPRWPFCEDNFRVDLLRALVFTQDLQALQFSAKVAADSTESLYVRQSAFMSLGSYAPKSIPLLLGLWSTDLDVVLKTTLVNSLLYGFDQPEVQNLLKQIANDPQTHDSLRAQLYRDFVRLMGADARAYLYGILQNEPRSQIRSWLNALLHEFF